MLARERRVSAATAVLTVISLAAVFATAGGAVPADALPQAPTSTVAVIPHVNAALAVVALVTIPLGVRAIRRGNVRRHRLLMTTTATVFFVFLALYLYKVAMLGTATFDGPDPVYRFVYLPVLGVHVLLAIACLPPLFQALLLAGTRRVEKLPETGHARAGRVAAPLLFVSFLLGAIVYAMAYLLY